MSKPSGPIDTQALIRRAQQAFDAGIPQHLVVNAARKYLNAAKSEVLPTGDLPAHVTPVETAAAGQNQVNQAGGNSNANNLLAVARSRGLSAKQVRAWVQKYQQNRASVTSTAQKVAYVESLSPGQKAQAQTYVQAETAKIARAKSGIPYGEPSGQLTAGGGSGGRGGGLGGVPDTRPIVDGGSIGLMALAGLVGYLVFRGGK